MSNACSKKKKKLKLNILHAFERALLFVLFMINEYYIIKIVIDLHILISSFFYLQNVFITFFYYVHLNIQFPE